MTIDHTPLLTGQERLAELDLNQLRQLIGLVAVPRRQRDPFPLTGWDAVVWSVGNATHGRRRSTRNASTAWSWYAYSGPATGQPRPPRLSSSSSGAVRFVLKGGVGPEPARSRTTTVAPRRRHRRHRPAGARRRPVHRATPAPRARRSSRNRTTSPTRARHRPPRRHRHLRRHPPHPRRPIPLSAAPTCPATNPRRSAAGAARPRPTAPAQALDRRRRGTVEPGPDGRVGRLLQPRHGLHQHGRIRRRRHRHRVLGADEQGRRQRQPPRQVPAQRTGGRQEALADRRVPRLLPAAPAPSTSPWPPATSSRAVDDPDAPAAIEFLGHARTPTTPTRRSGPGSVEVRVPIEELQRQRASSSTATRTATSSRSSPGPSATVRRCSSSSSSATARSVSARATSAPCSRPSNGSRNGAATSDGPIGDGDGHRDRAAVVGRRAVLGPVRSRDGRLVRHRGALDPARARLRRHPRDGLSERGRRGRRRDPAGRGDDDQDGGRRPADGWREVGDRPARSPRGAGGGGAPRSACSPPPRAARGSSRSSRGWTCR